MTINVLRYAPADVATIQVSFSYQAYKPYSGAGDTSAQGLASYCTAQTSIGGTPVAGVSFNFEAYEMSGTVVVSTFPFTVGPTSAGSPASARACPAAYYPYNTEVQVGLVGVTLPDGYSSAITSFPVDVNVQNGAKDSVAGFCPFYS